MKKIRLTLILLIALSLPSLAQDDARMIYSKSISQIITTNMEMSMDIKETDSKGRTREKSYDILMAKFGDVEKTRMTMQKPEHSKGITIIITDIPDETGIVEVYTPANGKTRKMKATPENMERVGSNFSLSEFASANPDDLYFNLLGKEIIDGKSCFKLSITTPSDSLNLNAEFMVEDGSYHIVRVILFDAEGRVSTITKLSDFQPLAGLKNKFQPMLLLTEDIKSSLQSRMEVIKISPRNDLKEEDFIIQGAGEKL